MVTYFKKDDKDEKKRIMAVGAVIFLVLGVGATQLSSAGREYQKKVTILEARGYELDGSVAWEDIDAWEEQVYIKLKKGVDMKRVEIETWAEFYGRLRDTMHAPVYDHSLYDCVHNCDESYVIWFSTVYLRGSSTGVFITYYIIPDG